MAFTIEPGIYLAGWGGVRIEDTVMVKNGKISVISKSTK
jgi:Xaa-Pro aminopeptidase